MIDKERFLSKEFANETSQCAEFILRFIEKLQYADEVKCLSLWYIVLMNYGPEIQFDDLMEGARTIFDSARRVQDEMKGAGNE